MTMLAQAEYLPAPMDRIVTLPQGVPEYTLGWEAISWAYEYIRHPNGPRVGLPWRYTKSQVHFLLWYYAIDTEARWIYSRAARRLAKGSGKSPHAAVIALTELCAPVRFRRWEPRALGGVIGMPQAMPLVQIAATSESQTANTMRMVRAMTGKKSKLVRAYSLDPGKTMITTPDTGELQIITSSAAAAEGAPVTFAVLDETEHWRPANGGELLSQVMDRNLTKSNSRSIETCNAWEPGVQSIAESTWDAWVAQEEGRTRSEKLILYDARVAPPETDLDDDDSLEAAIEAVYDDCYWVDKRTIKASILDIKTPIDVGRRFYLNQPVASLTSWTEPHLWSKMVNAEFDLKDGSDIALFFDGSRTQDATALMGCEIESGFVFTIGVWEPTPERVGKAAVPVPVAMVDAAVEHSFEKWNPVVFFADVREWESFARVEWPKRYGEKLKVWAVPGGNEPMPIAWDMRTHVYDFTMAAELVNQEIEDASFEHDGDSRTARHVGNAKRYPNRWGTSVSKETRNSPRKIDACTAMIGARMARRRYLGSLLTHDTAAPRTGKVHSF